MKQRVASDDPPWFVKDNDTPQRLILWSPTIPDASDTPRDLIGVVPPGALFEFGDAFVRYVGPVDITIEALPDKREMVLTVKMEDVVR